MKNDKWDETEFILNSVCEHYKVSKKALKYSPARGNLQEARTMCYCLLHRELGLSMRYVAFRIFELEQHSTVNNAIMKFRTLNTDLKHEKEYRETYEMFQKKLIEYINQNKKS